MTNSGKYIDVIVTWIPASELPKRDSTRHNIESVEVLAYTNQNFLIKARYDYQYNEWYITEGEDLEGSLCFNDGEEVIYYMYFPKLPKV